MYYGGKKPIFDLTKSYDFDDDLQKNLNKLHKLYGSNFDIKWNDYTINVSFYKETLPSNLTFHTIDYDLSNRSTSLLPFKINFFDIFENKLNNNSYISNIHKTDEISGTNMVKICLEINKKLGVKKTFLFDGASINCHGRELDLSFIKLIEHNKTFYMKLGFDFEITNFDYPFYKFNNKDELKKKINELISEIKKIKVDDIRKEYYQLLDIINKSVKTKQKLQINLINSGIVGDNIYMKENIDVTELFKNIYDVLNIFDRYNEKYLYKLLIKLFTENCYEYSLLDDYIIKNQIYTIQLNKTIIERKYIKNFQLLYNMRWSYYYSYQF